MLAERLKVFASRTCSPALLLAAAITGWVPAAILSAVTIAGAVTALPSPVTAQQPAASRSTLERGLAAYRKGDYETAEAAFRAIPDRADSYERLLAEFYLGRIYSDNAGNKTNHARAYEFLQRIADEHADVDPDDVRRAPFVAKALTTVAIYVRDGLPEVALKPDLERATEWLRHAATFFNDPDAQFELARDYIRSEQERKTGLHFLQKLSREGHPGAQAVLADLLAKGRFVPPNLGEALALVTMAVENAAPSERLWIEDIFQRVYCAANPQVRQRSAAVSNTWRKSFSAPRSPIEQPMALGRRVELAPARVCADGEQIDFALKRGTEATGAVTGAAPPATMLGIVPSGMARPGASGSVQTR